MDSENVQAGAKAIVVLTKTVVHVVSIKSKMAYCVWGDKHNFHQEEIPLSLLKAKKTSDPNPEAPVSG